MSIEVGSKCVKDGKVVSVIADCLNDCIRTNRQCVWFEDEKCEVHVLTRKDFSEQYKPYEPVYEYQYVLRNYTDCTIYESQRYYKDDNEFLEREVNDKNFKTFQRLDFTKRERK